MQVYLCLYLLENYLIWITKKKEKVKEAAPKKIYSLSTDSESIIDELVEA